MLFLIGIKTHLRRELITLVALNTLIQTMKDGHCDDSFMFYERFFIATRSTYAEATIIKLRLAFSLYRLRLLDRTRLMMCEVIRTKAELCLFKGNCLTVHALRA